jgi:Zn-dependent M28 family amino/carboxypeptidase
VKRFVSARRAPGAVASGISILATRRKAGVGAREGAIMRWTSLGSVSGVSGIAGAAASIALAAAAVMAGTAVMAQAQAKSPVAVDRIRASELAAHIKFLADDLLEGRAPATRGGDLAARYIASQFELLGLEPGGEPAQAGPTSGSGAKTFYQQVPIIESTAAAGFTLTTRGGKSGATFTAPTDLIAYSGSEQPRIDINAPVVFVGYGIVAPEYKWNDYEGVDVKGKVVMVMVNDPPAPAAEPTLFAGKALTYYGRWMYKYEEAARQGAAGAILIHTDESATYPWSVVQSSWSGAQYAVPVAAGTPVLGLKAWMTEEASRKLAAAGGQDLDALRKAALTRGAKAVDLGVSVEGALQQTVARKVSPNVIGVLKGTNAGASGGGESVIYSAHYDHIGIKPVKDDKGDAIYNGARDNASGVAAILEIAEAFVATGRRPARSIYFIATTGEESGLLGSEYFATHPTMAIDKVAVNINIDALNVYGTTPEIVLLGVERSDLRVAVEEAVKRWGRKLGQDEHPERGYFYRSDHFPLAKVGVPAVSITLANVSTFSGPNAERARKLATSYNETCYHQACDEFSADWDLTGAVQDLQLLADLGWRVAEAKQMPRYNPDEQFARPRKGVS